MASPCTRPPRRGAKRSPEDDPRRAATHPSKVGFNPPYPSDDAIRGRVTFGARHQTRRSCHPPGRSPWSGPCGPASSYPVEPDGSDHDASCARPAGTLGDGTNLDGGMFQPEPETATRPPRMVSDVSHPRVRGTPRSPALVGSLCSFHFVAFDVQPSGPGEAPRRPAPRRSRHGATAPPTTSAPAPRWRSCAPGLFAVRRPARQNHRLSALSGW